MEIIAQYMTANDCYKKGRSLVPKAIMVHATASPGVMAQDWYARWNKPGVQKCVHAFVDDARAVQYLPWDMRGWHAGGDANATHISFEICEDKGWNKDYFERSWTRAVELTVFLCRRFNLTEKDVISHKEGYLRGIASNHGDPDHWWSKFDKNMGDFRAAVAQGLGTGTAQEYEKEQEEMQWMKVTISDYLNLRDQPSNSGKVIGKLLPGQLVQAGEERSGWRAVEKGWAYGGKGYLSAVENVTVELPADAARELAKALGRLGF